MARSITKAVLRARWCTYRWAQELSRSLLSAAVDRLSRRTDLNTCVQEVLRQYAVASTDDRVERYFSASDSRRNEVASLECSYPLHLEFTTTEDGSPIFFADDTDHENTITLFEFTMSFCGAGSERHEKLQHPDQFGWLTPKSSDTPLSVLINRIIISTMEVDAKNPQQLWADLSQIYEEPIKDEYGEDCDRLYWRFNFRQQVAMDYFLSPERAPFNIPSRIFQRAAAFDLTFQPSYDRNSGIEWYTPRYIHHLFEIDPTSMPREDPTILRWASHACTRIRHFGYAYQKDRLQLRDSREYFEDSPMERLHTYRKQAMARYTFKVEVRMIRYLKTGETPYPLDCPAPHLHNAITQEEQTFGPGVDIAGDDEADIEEETFDQEVLATLDRQHREQIYFGPNPPELSFLDDNDYRGDKNSPDDDQTSNASANFEPERDINTEPSNVFENGSFAIEVVDHPGKGVIPMLDRIGLELRQRGKIYWLSPDDCKLPSQFVEDFKWYKKPTNSHVKP
jgi:hypothetical protein